MKMKKKNKIIFVIIVISMFLFSISFVSAKTIDIDEYSNYGNNLTPNEEIQNIIDSSDEGDIINFKGKHYSNLTIIINKKLNIQSSVNTKIENSNPNNTLNTIFLINSSAFGTKFAGFNLKNDYGTGIIINNYKNSNSSLKIFNNEFNSFKESSILLINSINIDIYENSFENSTNGIYIEYCQKILIKNNTFYNNRNAGIYFNKTVGNISINWNIFNKNLYGIILNSVNNENLSITQNTIVYSLENGILFEENFKTNDQDNIYRINVSLNSIFGSNDRNIYAGPCGGDQVILGINWMGSNYASMAALCPLTEVTLLQARLNKDSFGKFSVSFYSGRKKITDIPPIEVRFFLNGKDLVLVQTINGTANVDYSQKLIDLLEQENIITARVHLDSYTITLSPNNLKEEYENFINNENNNQGDNGETENENGNGNGNGNGTGNGTGSGVSNGTGTGTSDGTENGTGTGNGVEPESGDETGTENGVEPKSGEGTDTIYESENIQNNANSVKNNNSNDKEINSPKESNNPIANAGMIPEENSKSAESSDSKNGGGSKGDSYDKEASEISIVENTHKTNEMSYLPLLALFAIIFLGSVTYNKKTKFK
jgi:hypothetical protein